MPDKYKPPYAFSVTIGENCARRMRTFVDLADKLKMDVYMSFFLSRFWYCAFLERARKLLETHEPGSTG
jgi:hypothetical protein